jgi:peptide/nickel transport system substrate-binding protein
MVPPTDPWYEDLSGTYPFNTAKARELLKEAGYAHGLTLRMRLPVVPYATASGQFVASQLKDVGITIKTDELEFPRWLDVVFTKADYDISIVAHVEARDIVRFADPKYYFRYDNAQFARLITQADEGTASQQVSDMRAAAKILADDAAADWLFLLPNLVVTTANVHGVPQNATTLSFDLSTIKKTS